MSAPKNMKVIDRITEGYGKFTKTQKIIAGYICSNYRQIPAMSVQELARNLSTSDATIIRFSQSLGFKGYLDMRDALKTENKDYYAPRTRFNRFSYTGKEQDELGSKNKSLMDVMADNDMECYKDFYDNFDRDVICKVVSEINRAKNIHIVGFGVDSILATFLEWYLGLMGYQTSCYSDCGFTTARRFANVQASDLVIIFSTPRHLKIERSVIETAYNAGAYCICITPDNILELSSLCDLSITITDRSNEFINSYVTYIALCNMIIMAVYESNEETISKNLKEREDADKFFDILL